MKVEANRSRPSVVNGKTWLASFAVATLLGIGISYQVWASYSGPNKSPSFWDRSVLEPRLIPWLVWAAFAPLLMLVFERADDRAIGYWRRFAFYAMLGVGAVLLHAMVSGLFLGWWWSFPNPIPMDPAWHVGDLLRTRAFISLLIFALIAAVYHARVSRVAVPDAIVPNPTPAPKPVGAPMRAVQGPLALKVGDRIVFVPPHQVSWIEADGDYVVVHVGDTKHRVRDTITALEHKLASTQLVRVSRSAIVNMSAIAEMQPWFRGNFVIILRDGTRLQTGKKYRDRITRLI